MAEAVLQFPVEALTASALIDPQDSRLASLIQKVTESEESSREAREKSERDRDYLNDKQLTQDEYNALVARGQPPIALNVIKGRIYFLWGMEKRQRRDPKAWPRNPQDQPAADAFTDGMRYAVEEADYPTARSEVWQNITVEGSGGIELWVTPAKDGNYDIRMGLVPWDRLITDPHSSRPDYSDSNYVGQVLWLDEEEAIDRYPDADPIAIRNIIGTTLSPTSVTETFDDKPRATLWADRSRKRVRIVVMWCRHRTGWRFYEFTRGGILTEGDSPYVDEDGQSYCPLILESCSIDRENNRSGEVRSLIDPQDEINKRRSKALHLLSQRGVIADDGAVANVAEAKKQLAKPDFWISKEPGSDLELVTNSDLAAGQAQMGQQALAYISQTGPNAALLGKGVETQSGDAIERQQAGGMIEQEPLMDILRRLDRRVFRMVAQMMKQFWTAEKWIRVTDDELSPKWVGLNVAKPVTRQVQHPVTGQVFEQAVIDPMTGQPAVQIENNVGELDVDIIVTDAPDVVTLDGENYKSIVQLLGSAPNTPPAILRLLIEMHPGLETRRKKQLLDMLDQMQQADPAAQERQAIEREGAVAKIAKDKADARRSLAQAESTIYRAQQPPANRMAEQAQVGAI